MAQERAIRAIDAITAGFGPKKMDIFTRRVIVDDLIREAAAGRDIPFGFSYYSDTGELIIEKDKLLDEKRKIDEVIAKNPDIQEALNKRARLWKAVQNDLVTYKILQEGQVKEDYFRHQVLAYAQLRGTKGIGQKLKTPRPGYAKRRLGSTFDINSSYVEAEFQVLSQALFDIETAKNIEEIELSDLNIAEDLKIAAKAQSTPGNKVDWHTLIPDGYTTWQPLEGRAFYNAYSVNQKVINEVLEDLTTELDITDLRKVLAVGKLRKELVLPEEVAKTLNELYTNKPENFIHAGARALTTKWKQLVLFSPRRFLKYNFQNFIGDADAVIAGQPKIFSKFFTSVRELTDIFYRGKPMTPDMREFFERGGIDAQLTIQELPELKNLDIFKRLYQDSTKARSDVNAPRKAMKAYWETVVNFTVYREAMFRYAAYLYYKGIFTSGGAEYGASKKSEVDALKDPLDKAAKVATELLGDYGNISALGKELRETTIPFYSWLEINFKRYTQLTKNAFDEGFEKGIKTAGTLAGLKGGAFLLRYFIRIVGMTAIVALYNHLRFPEEESELSAYDQNRMHIVLGRDKEGIVRILRGQGAFSDIMEWFGLNEAPLLFREYFDGKASLAEIFGKIPLVTGRLGLKPAAMKLLRGVNPLYKLPWEILQGKTLPSLGEKGWRIEDKTRHILKAIQLENEYDAITKQPTRGYFTSISEAFITATDPGENAYRYIQGEKYKFLESKGIGGSGDYYSPNSILYRSYRKALRFNDEPAKARIEQQMRERGIKYKDVKRSLEATNPLFGLNTQQKREFLGDYLSVRDKERLGRAYKYYRETFLQKGKS